MLVLVACSSHPPTRDSLEPADSAAGSLTDSSTDSAGDSDTAPPMASLELIATSPEFVGTPPTWNANLPKLAGDADFLYAVHTWYADDVGDRHAAILARPRGGGAWEEVARVTSPHQPPGIVMDTAGTLHLVFTCAQDEGADTTCFPGGAGTLGQSLRFYHLSFSARGEAGRVRFDTYGNVNEWTGATNGYLGLGTSPDGSTWWSLATSEWSRVVQWWRSTTEYGTITTLSAAPQYLLYPVHAADEVGGLVLFAGEFDPSGGSNAAYLAATAWRGDLDGLAPLARVAPEGASSTIAAFPDDALAETTGDLLLAWIDDGVCVTALLSGGQELECLGTYAKLHRGSDALWLLDPYTDSGELRIARSIDEGASWEWTTLAMAGADTQDAVILGFTLARPDTAPALHDPEVIRFFASGQDEDALAARSYYGEVELR